MINAPEKDRFMGWDTMFGPETEPSFIQIADYIETPLWVELNSICRTCTRQSRTFVQQMQHAERLEREVPERRAGAVHALSDVRLFSRAGSSARKSGRPRNF